MTYEPQNVIDASTAESDCWLMPDHSNGWIQLNLGKAYWIHSVRILNTHFQTAYAAVTCHVFRIDGHSNPHVVCHAVLPQYPASTTLVVNAHARAIRIDIVSTLPLGGGLNEVVITGWNVALDILACAVVLVIAILIVVVRKRGADVCAAVLFSLILVMPHLDHLFNVFPTAANTEKRVLAPWPQLDHYSNVQALITGYETYINDNFGLRDLLIHAHATMQLMLWKRSPVASELIGQDGWLFNDHRGLIDDFRGLRPYTDDNLRTIKRNMERERDWLRAHGAHYLVLIGPNKSTIYPEYLPRTLRRYRTKTRLDQLCDYLRQHSDIDLVDLRPALRLAKTAYPVYYKTDLHWNDYGGFIAYCEIMRHLARLYPQLAPLTAADMQVSVVTNSGYGSDAFAMNTPGMWEDYSLRLTPIYAMGTNHYRIPTLLVFQDSFIAAVAPFLKHDCDTLILEFNNWRDAAGWRETDSQLVERLKPDVVLYEMAEYVQDWLK